MNRILAALACDRHHVRRCAGIRRAGLLAAAGRAGARLGPGRARVDHERQARPPLLHRHQCGRLLRIDRPGAQPTVLAEGIDGILAVMVDRDGTLVVGFGNSNTDALADNGNAGLMRVDPEYRPDDRDHHPGTRQVERDRAWPRRRVLRLERLRRRHRPVPRGRGDRQLVTGGDAQRARGRLDRPLPVRRADVQAGLDRPDRPRTRRRPPPTWPPVPPTSPPAPTGSRATGRPPLRRRQQRGRGVARRPRPHELRAGARPAHRQLAQLRRRKQGFPNRNLYAVTFTGQVVELANVLG